MTVFGAVIFSVSASDDAINEERTIFPRWGLGWLDDLTEEQLATLHEKIEENKVEIEENRAEIESQLESWGIEIPALERPKGILEDLTEEQKEELQRMKQEFKNEVDSTLEEWGVEVPKFDGTKRFGKPFNRRGPKGFCLFKP